MKKINVILSFYILLYAESLSILEDHLRLAANCCGAWYNRINNHLHDRNQCSLLRDEEKWKVRKRSIKHKAPLWGCPCLAWSNVLKSDGSALARRLWFVSAGARLAWLLPPSALYLHLELPVMLLNECGHWFAIWCIHTMVHIQPAC